ncbi:MAG: 50S ribosomal protein L23 [Mycoplasmataceae bacterium]|jgi:large subunit ribosomal protein L23|nr:50S ribosomal protein L23 [Mycoplasmataceae bacterium]
MDFTRIIIRPLHSEKTYALQSLASKKYCFVVDIKATKHDIAIAFESIYGIHPVKVATQIRKPTNIRTGTAKPGYSKMLKLAYVTLPVGKDISNSATTDKPTAKTTKKEHPDLAKKEVVKKEVVKKEADK